MSVISQAAEEAFGDTSLPKKSQGNKSAVSQAATEAFGDTPTVPASSSKSNIIAGYRTVGRLSNASVHYGTHAEDGVYDITVNEARRQGKTLDEIANDLTGKGYIAAVRTAGERGISSNHIHFADETKAPKEAARLRKQSNTNKAVHIPTPQWMQDLAVPNELTASIKTTDRATGKNILPAAKKKPSISKNIAPWTADIQAKAAKEKAAIEAQLTGTPLKIMGEDTDARATAVHDAGLGLEQVPLEQPEPMIPAIEAGIGQSRIESDPRKLAQFAMANGLDYEERNALLDGKPIDFQNAFRDEATKALDKTARQKYGDANILDVNSLASQVWGDASQRIGQAASEHAPLPLQNETAKKAVQKNVAEIAQAAPFFTPGAAGKVAFLGQGLSAATRSQDEQGNTKFGAELMAGDIAKFVKNPIKAYEENPLGALINTIMIGDIAGGGIARIAKGKSKAPLLGERSLQESGKPYVEDMGGTGEATPLNRQALPAPVLEQAQTVWNQANEFRKADGLRPLDINNRLHQTNMAKWLQDKKQNIQAKEPQDALPTRTPLQNATKQDGLMATNNEVAGNRPQVAPDAMANIIPDKKLVVINEQLNRANEALANADATNAQRAATRVTTLEAKVKARQGDFVEELLTESEQLQDNPTPEAVSRIYDIDKTLKELGYRNEVSTAKQAATPAQPAEVNTDSASTVPDTQPVELGVSAPESKAMAADDIFNTLPPETQKAINDRLDAKYPEHITEQDIKSLNDNPEDVARVTSMPVEQYIEEHGHLVTPNRGREIHEYATKLDAAKTEPVTKEPWEMTKTEWTNTRNKLRPSFHGGADPRSPNGKAANIDEINRLGYGIRDDVGLKLKEALDRVKNGQDSGLTPNEYDLLQEQLDTPIRHEEVIKKALSEGKPVPAEVLADYPDLAAKYGKPETPVVDSKVPGEAGFKPPTANEVANKANQTPNEMIIDTLAAGKEAAKDSRARYNETGKYNPDNAKAGEYEKVKQFRRDTVKKLGMGRPPNDKIISDSQIRSGFSDTQLEYFKDALKSEIPDAINNPQPGETFHIKIPKDGSYDVIKTPEAIGMHLVTLGEKTPKPTATLDTKIAEVKARAGKKLTSQLNTGVDPTLLYDAAELGYLYLKKGITNITEWKNAILADHPELKDHLDTIWKELHAKGSHEESWEAIRPNVNHFEKMVPKPEPAAAKVPVVHNAAVPVVEVKAKPAKPVEPNTGIRKSITMPEREARGLEPVELQKYPKLKESYEAAKKAVDTDKIDPRALARHIATKPRAMTPVESSAIAYDRQRLTNKAKELEQEIDKTELGSPELESLKNELDMTRESLDYNDQAARIGGREASAALNIFRVITNEDYSLETLLVRKRATLKTSEGRTITSKEEVNIKAEHTKLEALQSEKDALQKKYDELASKIKVSKEESKPKVRTFRPIIRNVSDFKTIEYGNDNKIFTKELVAAAKQRLKEKSGRLNAGVDPTMVADLAIIIGEHIEAGARFSYKVISQHLKDEYGASNEAIKKAFVKATNDKRLAEAMKRRQKYLSEIDQAISTKTPLPEKIPRVDADVELLFLQDKIDAQKAKLNDLVGPPKSLGYKIRNVAASVLNAPTGILAAWDDSFIGRQGLMMLTYKPKSWAKATQQSITALGSEKTSWHMDMAIRNDKNFPLAQRSGLAHTTLSENAPLSSAEESAMYIRASHKIPVLGAALRPFDRAYTTAANVMRHDAFYRMAEAMGDKWSPEEYKAYASFLNKLTGRGELGRLSSFQPELSGLFISSRKIAADVQLLTSPVANPKVVRGEAQKALVGYVAAIASLGLIVNASKKGHVGLNPSDPDFFKLRIGNTRYDLSGGRATLMRAIYKTGVATYKYSRWGDAKYGTPTPSQEIIRYLGYKVSPGIATGKALFTGKDIWGKDQSIEQTAKNLITPWNLSGVIDAWKNEGAGIGAVSAIANFWGVSTSTYKDRTKAKPTFQPSSTFKSPTFKAPKF